MWQISIAMTEIKISKISGIYLFLKDKKRRQIKNKNILKI